MREGEKELERESQEVTEAAWAAHEAYIASVEEAEAAITKAAVDAEEAVVKAGSNAAVAWQGWAHEQFTNKQAAGWCRQLIHLAQLHEDTTKGRRDAFDEARERRRADADGRREKHATEWAEATAELSAKLAELHEFAKGAPARWREAATTCLAEIHERQTKECEESLQKKYAAAWEEEQAAYRLAQELVQAGVDSDARDRRADARGGGRPELLRRPGGVRGGDGAGTDGGGAGGGGGPHVLRRGRARNPRGRGGARGRRAVGPEAEGEGAARRRGGAARGGHCVEGDGDGGRDPDAPARGRGARAGGAGPAEARGAGARARDACRPRVGRAAAGAAGGGRGADVRAADGARARDGEVRGDREAREEDGPAKGRVPPGARARHAAAPDPRAARRGEGGGGGLRRRRPPDARGGGGRGGGEGGARGRARRRRRSARPTTRRARRCGPS